MPNFIIKNIKTQAPIQNLGDQMNEITVVRREDLQAAHWEAFLHAVNGGIVKVDLMKDGYRVLYDASIFVGSSGTSEKFALNPTLTLGEVIQAVKQLGNEMGDWTGTEDYNCQDFVIAFMKKIRISDSLIFNYELRRTATKLYPPTITETIGGVVTSRI